MADYGQDCCGRMGGHEVSCKLHHNYANWKAEQDYLAKCRVDGFLWSEQAHAFKCRRGCGTLVWDMKAHKANVCPEFNPIVGNEKARSRT